MLQRVVYRACFRAGSRPHVAEHRLIQNVTSPSRPIGVATRHWSAKTDNDENKSEEKESLQDAVRRMQEKGGQSAVDDSNDQLNGFLRKASDVWSTFSEEVGKTWHDLLKSGDRKDINKKLIHPEDTVEGDAPYTGPVQIMVIDESEHLTAWERMQRRLTEAPIISGEWDRIHLFIG